MTKPVAILGANGTVGQKAIALLLQAPYNQYFHVAEVAASEGRVGKLYHQEIDWREKIDLPDSIKNLKFTGLTDIKSSLVISALPAEVAQTVEPQLAEKGHFVFSNASSFRMDKNIPLLIPEINPEHLQLLNQQKTKGKIVTNPNCSTVFLVMALAPLQQLAAIKHVNVTTLQAISGAGYPGVPSLDIVGNFIPYIGGEEEKIEKETKRIMGTPFEAAPFTLSVLVNRIPVHHGHTITIHVDFEKDVSADQVKDCFLQWNKKFPDLYKIYDQPNRPQPLRDLDAYDTRAHIGRIKSGGRSNQISLICLGHNLVRGAAGAAILNMMSALPKINLP